MADPTLQRAMMRGMLSLPRPVLRLLSGGGVVYQGGRTLDPRFQYLAHQARGAPSLASLTPAEARLASAQMFRTIEAKLEPGVAIETLSLAAGDGTIAARAYRPADQDPAAPVMVYAHMGGGVIGDLETCHVFCTILAKAARCAVLSVDYRLAPEHRFPAGLEDTLAAFRWARDNAASLGG